MRPLGPLYQRLPDVFRGYRKRPVAWNGLKEESPGFNRDWFDEANLLSIKK